MSKLNGKPPSHLTITLADRLKNRGRDYTRLLRCPIDNEELTLDVEGNHLICAAGHHYFDREGILFLLDEAQQAIFDKQAEEAFAAHQAEGRHIPEEAGFKRLPQTGLEGYPMGYWDLRAHATAEMWRFLEALRIEAKKLPIGDMGTAVDFTDGMGWLGYGLDVSGYATVIVGHDTTQFGLSVYEYGRYPRVQAAIENPPLTEKSFDLVLYTYSLPQVSDIAQTIKNGVKLLKPKGHVLVFLDDDQSDLQNVVENAMENAGLVVKQQRVGAMGGRIKKITTNLRGGPGVPPILIGQLPG